MRKIEDKKIFRSLLVMFYWFILADFYLTYIGISNYGFTEGNPLMSYLMEIMGLLNFTIILPMIIGVILYGTYRGYDHITERAKKVTIFVTLFALLIRVMVVGGWVALIGGKI